MSERLNFLGKQLITGEEKMSVKTNSPETKGEKTKEYPTVKAVVIRKRITYTPKEDTQLRRVSIGYWEREVSTVEDIVKTLRDANMPGVNQVKYEDGALVITKRRFKRGERAEKIGRYYRVKVPVKTAGEALAVLKQYGFVNDQIIPVGSTEDVKDVVKKDKERIERRERRKRKNEQ